MTEVIGTPERRQGADRRADGGEAGGRRDRKPPSTLSYVLRSLAAVVVLVFIIIFAVRHTRPVYATSGTVVEQLRKRAPVAAAVIAPPVESTTVQRLVASPKYQEEKRNFYEDLMR